MSVHHRREWAAAGLIVASLTTAVWALPKPISAATSMTSGQGEAIVVQSGQLDWHALQDTAVQDLQTYIRFDTTNPPGHNREAAVWLAGRLQAEGIPAQIVETAPGLFNVVGVLRGSGKEAPLLLVHHMDVVPAQAEDWQRPPFSGELVDGEVWGRGAVDDKGPGVMALTALSALKRLKTELNRDVYFVAVADEETGGDRGIRLLLEQMPELKRAEMALMLDGAFGLEVDGVKVLPVGVSEKASVALRITLQGKGGHASVPLSERTALERLTEGMQRLTKASQTPVLPPEVEEMLRRLGARTGGAKGWLLRHLNWPPVRWALLPVISRDPLMAALTHRTVAWTGLSSGVKYNVYPTRAEAMVDIRILPGTTPETTIAWVKKTLALPDATIETLESKSPSQSNFDTAWFRQYEAVAALRYPEALVVPMLSPGATDGRHTRPAGIPTYVAVPAYIGRDLLSTAHERDERLPVTALGDGARFLVEYLVAAGT